MPLLDRILSVVAPHQCLSCGREGALLCIWCESDALPALPSRCYRCHALTRDFAVCDRCRNHTALRHVWIRTSYESVAKELVHGLKYERQLEAARHITTGMHEVLPMLLNEVYLLAIPTATTRQRQRGYDHAQLIARGLSRKSNLLNVRAVTRLNQSRQVGAGRRRRFEQLKGAFLVTKPSVVQGKHIILVDDIVTTGATLETVANLLKEAGAKRVDAVVFAQKK